MLREGTQKSYIESRVNMPTAKSHAEIVRDIAPQIKARSFFSARVAEAHILERMREVSDRYSKGEIGLGEARNILKDFLQGENYNPHQAGLRNLASTARLNLVLKQNAAMAHAAGEWKRMHDPDAMKVFPYVRYHSRGDSRTRSSHDALDGKIYDKNDPFLRTHTPPWEFNCRCWLEEITAKEAGREPDHVMPPTPEDQVHVESQSGFEFDPEKAFEKFELVSVRSSAVRQSIHKDIVQYCSLNETSVSLQGAPAPQKLLQESYREPDNIEEIKKVFQKVEKRKSLPKENLSVSVGRLLPEHAERLGLSDFDDKIMFFHPGHSKAGTQHWEKNHNDTLNFESALKLFRLTIWNPYAQIREDINGKKRRICIYVKDRDSGQLTNIWVVKDVQGNLKLELIDSWSSPRKYIDSIEKK